MSLNLPHKLLQMADDIRSAGGRVFLVGGVVRDHFLKAEGDIRDYDLEVYSISQDTLFSVLSKHGKPNLIGKAFGVLHLSRGGIHYDFSFPRTESKMGIGHRAFEVKTDPNLTFEEAAKRRDFTINAMGMELPDLKIYDPYNGQSDLQNKILRHTSEAFCEDSLRVIRGVQFAARFELRGAPETIELCKTLSLADLSRERIEEEFRKFLLKGVKPSFGLDFFVAVGLPKMFPEICPSGDWKKLGEILDRSSELSFSDSLRESRDVFMFSAFLSSPNADILAFLKKWVPVNNLLKRVPAVLETLKFLNANDDSSLRRAALKTGGLKHPAMLNFAIDGDENFYLKIKKLAEEMQIWEKAPENLLTGQMLLEMGLSPGRQLGALIKQNFELQLEGKIKTRKEALEMARISILRN